MLHHPRTRVNTDYQLSITDDGCGFPGEESGARSNIEDCHTRLEPRTSERATTVPGAGAEPKHSFHSIVIAGRAIEYLAYPPGAVAFRFVILANWEVWRRHGTIESTHVEPCDDGTRISE
jgi:hypothetical protein